MFEIFKAKKIFPLVELKGVIGTQGWGALNIINTDMLLEDAFLMSSPGVGLLIDSPGGSPSQSSLIFQRIRYFSQLHKKPVISFISDVAASGGYYMACAGDEIYANENSIIGGIGVLSHGIGLDKFMEKFGIERRIISVNEKKAPPMDPLSPITLEQIERIKKMQESIFSNFVKVVKERRGEKLSQKEEDVKDMFSGDVWTGSQLIESKYGLIDGVGTPWDILKQKYGEDVQTRILKSRRPMLFRFFSPETIASAVTESVIQQIEAKYWHDKWKL